MDLLLSLQPRARSVTSFATLLAANLQKRGAGVTGNAGISTNPDRCECLYFVCAYPQCVPPGGDLDRSQRRRNNLSTPPSQIDAHPGRSVPGFAPLDNLPLDPRHSPAIEIPVIRVLNVHISCQTHVVRCSIAPRTDLLRSSNRLPFKPRSRVLQISAHRAQGRHNPLYWPSSPTKT